LNKVNATEPSENVYVNIHTTKGKVVHRAKLVEMIEALPNSNFTRVHQSFIVNKSYVEKVTSTEVHIAGTEIPVSRTYKSIIQDL
jgi:two-component system, LytTR family, response regulator LytT